MLVDNMAKNLGLIPSMRNYGNREIARKRFTVGEMLNGCWDSCVQPDPIYGLFSLQMQSLPALRALHMSSSNTENSGSSHVHHAFEQHERVPAPFGKSDEQWSC